MKLLARDMTMTLLRPKLNSMARTLDGRIEGRALRRAELLLARVKEDCGPNAGLLSQIEPLLTRLDRIVENGERPRLRDVEQLASAGHLLEAVTLHARGVNALRHDLVSELNEIAERLRPIARAEEKKLLAKAEDRGERTEGRAAR